MTDREIDVLVAEKVIGLKVRFEKGTPPMALCPPNDYIVLKADGTPEPCVYLPGGIGVLTVDKYSTQIAAAWKVVDKMIERGYRYKIEGQVAYPPDQSKGVFVTTAFFMDLVGRVSGDWTASAPRAICEAALRAVGHGIVEDLNEIDRLLKEGE